MRGGALVRIGGWALARDLREGEYRAHRCVVELQAPGAT